MFDAIKDPVVIISRDGTVLEANDSFSSLAGVQKAVLQGKDCRDIDPLSSFWNSITGCMLERTEKRERIDHRDRTFDVTISPISTDDLHVYACVVFRDATLYLSLEREIRRKNFELTVMNALSETFISSREVESIYRNLLERILVITDTKIGWLIIMEDGGMALKCESGVSDTLRDRIRSGAMDFLLDRSGTPGEPFFVMEEEEAGTVEALRDEGISFVVSIPIWLDSSRVGALVLASRTAAELEIEGASLFRLIGNHLSLLIEKIKLLEKLQVLATTDSLTGIANMRSFFQVLEQEINRTKRYAQPFSIVLFDVDDFKLINDSFGHQTGDTVLAEVAKSMVRMSRKTDTVARYGGEEFIVLLPNTPKPEAHHLANRIKIEVEGQHNLANKGIALTMSGGVASFPDDADDEKTLFHAADMAMYEAKAAGKSRISMYQKKLNGGAPR